MSKITSVYVGMLAIFALGLWIVVSCGTAYLRAPTDMAGEWELDPATKGTEADAPFIEPVPMHIDQSGRFFRVSIADRVASMKLQSETLSPQGLAELRLTGDGLEMHLTGPADSDEFRIQASGAIEGVWTAIRTERTYPRRRGRRPASGPA